jgi:hypothetical protein
MKKRDICKKIVKEGNCEFIDDCNECAFSDMNCDHQEDVVLRAKKWLEKHPKTVSYKKYKEVVDLYEKNADKYAALMDKYHALKESSWKREQKPVDVEIMLGEVLMVNSPELAPGFIVTVHLQERPNLDRTDDVIITKVR